jgi:hypothetical protein
MYALAGVFSRPASAESVDSKYTLISAYIYNFTQLTTWPSAAIKDTFNVCVVGSDPFGSNLEPIQTATVNDEKIKIRHYSADATLTECHIVFVSDSEGGNLRPLLKRLRGEPVLTMSDIPGFSNSGGMVEFKLEGGKIDISVALSEVRVTGLSISKKMLSLSNMMIR